MKRTPIKRRTAMNRVNKKRKRKRAEDGKVYGPYHRWISRQPCVVDHICAGDVKGHHLTSVGAGGHDYANEVPLCFTAHDTVHWVGRETFEASYGIDLRAEAMRYAKLWDEREGKNGSAS